jgi:hypothetical protein
MPKIKLKSMAVKRQFKSDTPAPTRDRLLGDMRSELKRITETQQDILKSILELSLEIMKQRTGN